MLDSEECLRSEGCPASKECLGSPPQRTVNKYPRLEGKQVEGISTHYSPARTAPPKPLADSEGDVPAATVASPAAQPPAPRKRRHRKQPPPVDTASSPAAASSDMGCGASIPPVPALETLEVERAVDDGGTLPVPAPGPSSAAAAAADGAPAPDKAQVVEEGVQSEPRMKRAEAAVSEPASSEPTAAEPTASGPSPVAGPTLIARLSALVDPISLSSRGTT